MKKILLTTCLLLFTIKIYAYENNYFKIDIPNNFKEDFSQKNIYKWINTENNHEDIVITFTTNDGKAIKNYTENDIKDYQKYIEDEINNQLKNYNITISVNNTKKEIINDIYCISYETLWPVKNSIGYNIYQKGYTFSSENYVYVYTFTSDNELSNNEAIKNTINSFKFLDKKINNNIRIKLLLIVGITGGIIGYIVKAIKKKHNSK